LEDKNMLDGLNKYGLPIKYAVLCMTGGIAVVFLANMFGLNKGGATYLSAAIATGAGGALGGLIRQSKGKKN
jgi:NADPH-dependent curcumin reductase CurA